MERLKNIRLGVENSVPTHTELIGRTMRQRAAAREHREESMSKQMERLQMKESAERGEYRESKEGAIEMKEEKHESLWQRLKHAFSRAPEKEREAVRPSYESSSRMQRGRSEPTYGESGWKQPQQIPYYAQPSSAPESSHERMRGRTEDIGEKMKYTQH